MSRPMSAVLRKVYERLELCSSVLQALDDCQRYGDITRVEYQCADRIIERWLCECSTSSLNNVTAKRLGFKKLIQTQEERERTVI